MINELVQFNAQVINTNKNCMLKNKLVLKVNIMIDIDHRIFYKGQT